MNREIKFRAWDGERLRNVNTIGWLDEEIDWVDTPRYSGPIYDNIKIMQHTGLKDRNGVEIYEGDIIRYFSEVMSKKEWICSVEVIGATFAVRTGKKSYMDGSFLNRLSKDEKLEIIGNIYENPELLEETK